MRIVVLGSAAGGGVPQWNCNSESCRLARGGNFLIKPRTQSSIAVSADGDRFILLNCSPDLRQQINDNADLHPRADAGLRNSPIEAVVLTNGDVDHIAGLLTLRESEAFRVYASARVSAILAGNPIFNVLNPEFVSRETFALDQPFAVAGPDGEPLGIEIEAFAVPGKVALFMEDESQGDNFGTQAEDTVGLHVRETATGKSFYYAPGCARLDDALRARLKGARLVMFDGTLFRNEEMVDAGLGVKTGERMGHINMDGDDGSLAGFADLGVTEKIYIHINNSNPVLREDSPERKQVEAAGWKVARDGQIVNL